jgi:hypothetical protein
MWSRSIRAVVAIAIVVSAGLLVAPSRSYAASGVTTTAGSFTNDDSFLSTLDADWRIGDCTLVKALNPHYSYVRLSEPDEAGNAVLTWGGVGRTRDGNDIWHTTFTFLTALDATVATMPRLSGDRMAVAGQFYPWSRRIDVFVDPELYPAIRMVRWNSSC